MSLFETPNDPRLGSLNIAPFLSLPKLINFIAEWAALLPFVCHLASYRHSHQLVGRVALLGRLSVSMFPKLGVLSGTARLLEEGPEYLDIASTLGTSSRRVWDVMWGSRFPCANGAAGVILEQSMLRTSRKKVVYISDIVIPVCELPSSKVKPEGETEPQLTPLSSDSSDSQVSSISTITKTESPTPKLPSQLRRIQTLHIIHFSRTEQSRARKSYLSYLELLQQFLPIQAATLLAKLGFVILAGLFGLYGTAIILLSSSITQLVCQTAKISRPPTFLENNEAHNASMLVAAHENASTWHLFMGDRGVVDSLLNKPLLIIPRQKLTATWLKGAHFFQLLAMTFVASQKGWDGVTLLLVLILSRLTRFQYRDELLADRFCSENQVSIDLKSFHFPCGRNPMIGTIQKLSGSRVFAWMDDILCPSPRRDSWLEILRLGAAGDVTPDRMDEQMRGLSDFDKDSVYKNERLTNHAYEVIKAALPRLTV